MSTNGTALARQDNEAAAVELALVGGDLSRLSAAECVNLYTRTCESLGLNPLTKPFDYLVLNGKKILYARKDATEQLRKINRVSIAITGREVADGVLTVTARATFPDGRFDEDVGAVTVANLKGDALANATMKCFTKAKRRVTLSICGLGMLDESEIETIPASAIAPPPSKPVPIKRTVDPVEDIEASLKVIADYKNAINAAPTIDDLRTVSTSISKQPRSICEAVRDTYAARLKQLKVQPAPTEGAPVSVECSICRGNHPSDDRHACE